MGIAINTEVAMWILMQKMHRYISFEKHLYIDNFFPKKTLGK